MTEIFHAVTAEDRAAMTAMRQMLGGRKPELTRPLFDEIMEHTPDAAGVSYETGTVGGVTGVWCRPASARSGAVILYLHGGAYIVGSAQAYRHLAGQIAAHAGMAAFVPDYRLAPEHPFPAAVDDVRAVYRGLVDRDASAIAIVGDSAGGGLALALLGLATADAHRGVGRAPLAGVALSAWSDLALTGASLKTRLEEDPYFGAQTLGTGAAPYLKGHDPRDPLASPLYGDLEGLPPIQMHVGTAEVLFDDSQRFAARAQAAKVEVALHIWEGMPHVFPSNVGRFTAAAAALDEIGAFLAEKLG